MHAYCFELQEAIIARNATVEEQIIIENLFEVCNGSYEVMKKFL